MIVGRSEVLSKRAQTEIANCKMTEIAVENSQNVS